MHRAVAVIASCLLGGTLALTGCGQKEAEPRPHQAPSSSPSPTVSAAPTMPAAAKKKTKAGAEAFVRHYIDLINYAQRSGDTNPLITASSKYCEGCKAGANFVNEVRSDGGRIEGGEWRLISLSVGERLPDRPGWVLDTRVDYGPQTVTRPGRKARNFGGGSDLYTWAVAIRHSQFQIDSLVKTPK